MLQNMSLKNYNKPRPYLLKVIGDTMMYAGTSLAGAGILAEEKILALVSLVLGVGGYFFTQLFAAKVEADEADNQQVN